MFRGITIYKILYESVRSYFAVNAKGALSVLYKFCLCCVYPLQTPFNNFDIWRQREILIANCKWQYGQLAYVLNKLYNTTLITIGLSSGSSIFAPNIEDGGSILFAPNIEDGGSTLFAPNIGESVVTGAVIINVPTTIVNSSNAQLTADLNQIVLPGISYIINPI
jgi:hypothetical protein